MHSDIPTIPLIAFVMIIIYHILFGLLCQFFPTIFFSPLQPLFFLPMHFFAPCLPNVYQKRAESLGTKGVRKFPFFVCLPNVYQRHFFGKRGAVCYVLGQFLKEKLACKGRYTPLTNRDRLTNRPTLLQRRTVIICKTPLTSLIVN